MAKKKKPPPYELVSQLPLDQEKPTATESKGKGKGKAKKLHQISDKVSHYAVRMGGWAFVLFILPRLKPETVELLGYLHSRPAGKPNSPLRLCDFIVALKILDDIIEVMEAINVELQTEADGHEIERCLDYTNALVHDAKFIRLILNGDFVPGTCFVFLKKHKAKLGSLSFKVHAQEGHQGTTFKLDLDSDAFYMADVDAREFLEQVCQGQLSGNLLYWVPLMDGADQEDIIEEWLSLANIHIAKDELPNLAFVAQVFAEVAGREEIWRPHLEAWQPVKSKLHQEWYQGAKAEGAIESLRSVLLTLLAEKFPPLVEAVRSLLPNLNDPTRLHDLCGQVVKAKTEKEFRAFIGV